MSFFEKKFLYVILSYFRDTIFCIGSEDVNEVVFSGFVMHFATGPVVVVSICGFKDVLMGVLMDVCIVVLKGIFAFERLHSGTTDGV